MNLYIMRHGTTNWNEQGRSQGRSQNRLSKRGIAQTTNASKKYKNTLIDIIYVSPMMRTRQTANIMNEYHNAKIIKDDRIIEVDQGVFTGRLQTSLTPEELKIKKSKSEEYGMESYDKVMSRAREFIKFLKQECTYDNVLVVTHCIVATYLDYVLHGYTHDYTVLDKMNPFENAEIRKYKI